MPIRCAGLISRRVHQCSHTRPPSCGPPGGRSKSCRRHRLKSVGGSLVKPADTRPLEVPSTKPTSGCPPAACGPRPNRAARCGFAPSSTVTLAKYRSSARRERSAARPGCRCAAARRSAGQVAGDVPGAVVEVARIARPEVVAADLFAIQPQFAQGLRRWWPCSGGHRCRRPRIHSYRDPWHPHLPPAQRHGANLSPTASRHGTRIVKRQDLIPVACIWSSRCWRPICDHCRSAPRERAVRLAANCDGLCRIMQGQEAGAKPFAQRRLALMRSSADGPGQRSGVSSVLSGASTVFRWWCRSFGVGST